MGKLNQVTSTLTQTFAKMAAPAAAATAAITGMAMAGFQGTVEIQQLQLSMQLFHREVASVFIPVIEAITAAYRRLWQMFTQMGPAAQMVLLIIGVGLLSITIGMGVLIGLFGIAAVVGGILAGAIALIGVAIEIVNIIIISATSGLKGLFDIIGAVVVMLMVGVGAAGAAGFAGAVAGLSAAMGGLLVYSAGLRNALWNVIEAMIRVAEAAWPIVKAFLAIAAVVADRAIVQPLIALAFWLELNLNILEKIIEAFVSMVPLIGRLGAGLDFKSGPKRDVTLNQTGTESSEGTFQRMQQAALQVGVMNVTPLEKNTTALETLVATILTWIEKLPSMPTLPETPSVSTIVGTGLEIGTLNAGGLAARIARNVF